MNIMVLPFSALFWCVMSVYVLRYFVDKDEDYVPSSERPKLTNADVHLLGLCIFVYLTCIIGLAIGTSVVLDKLFSLGYVK